MRHGFRHHGPGGWPHHHHAHDPEGPHGLRGYYGAHLHRRLFFWFGAAIFMTAGVVGWFGHGGQHWFLRPWILGAVGLWLLSRGIARRIARPLYELVMVSKEIGRGNLAARAQLACGGIDEIAVLARSMNDMATRIERQLADQRELLAAVSHELRTPLARMRILLDIARDRGPEPRTYDEIERELLEMDRLVGELLASARLEFQALRTQMLDAGDAAARALERAGLPAAKLEHNGGDLRFEGDPTLVGRALANLIGNAQKHGRGMQRLAVRTRPDYVIFEVDDAGPGFPPGAEAAAFQPFARVTPEGGGAGPAAASESSLGLGLSLVARIARAHGGSVKASNRPEGGARVTLELAARRPAA
jgi:two-component system OmpR family sensor kinase